MFKNIKELPKDVQAKLSEEQQIAFMEAFNASEAGTESEKLRAGWEAAVKMNSRIVHHAFLFRPGKFDFSTGPAEMTKEEVDDAVFAMNKCEEMGVPLGLKYDHSSSKRSIPVGVIRGATLEGDLAYGDLYVLQDARADLDGAGIKTLVDIDQMADALLTDGMKLSVEADLDVKIPSYYGDRIIAMEPTSMAILPTGLAPAVTEKRIAEREGNKSIAFIASAKSHERGNKMELAELVELVNGIVGRLDKLEESLTAEKKEPEKKEEDAPTIAELEKKNVDLQAKLDEAETEKLTAEVEVLTEEVTEKMLPGQVDNLKAELGKITDLSEKKVMLSRLNSVIEPPEAKEQKLRAGRRDSGSAEDKLYAERDKQVEKRMADYGESKYTALRTVNKTFDFGREE